MEEDEFPTGLKILVVDDDETCLFILERMLQSLNYQVTKCRNAEEALCMLREDKGKFDIVISDVHMLTMEEGFKLLETVGLEMKLPVIMMSSDDNHETMKKGIIHGACDYLVKPFQRTALKLIWQHVVRNRRNKEALAVAVAEPKSCVLVEDDDDDDDDDDDLVASPAKKRRRLVWTAQLHQQFVTAVNQLGHKNCHPKKILDRMQQMGARGLTRENVASHLQMVNGTAPANHDIGQSQTSLNQDVTESNATTFYPTTHESIPCGENYNFYINESCFGIPTVEEQHYNKDMGSIVDEHSNWDKLLVDDSQRFKAGSCSYDQPSFEAIIYAQNHVAIDDYMPRPFIEEGTGLPARYQR
ncbi:two-component response regulator ARR2 [Prunus persica]|uniref:two-component response regulator ARR2 n=1 Tax=Prunus persica TaxID=3760 RepID=UPI0009ABA4A8|nr:two-component response regulator ARR2 [Prunus persica]